MHFIRTIQSCVWDPAFYQRVQAQSLGTAMWFWARLTAIGIGIMLVIAYVSIIPFANPNQLQPLEDAYPDDLIVTIMDGKMSVNQPQPYYIENSLFDSDSVKYLAIFDGNDELPTDLNENKTILLLKEKYAIAPGQNKQQQIISFSSLATSTVTIEKSSIVDIVEKVKPYVAPIVFIGGAIIMLLAWIFGTIFVALFHMLYILVPAVLVFLFGKLRNLSMPFGSAYMVALYASAPVAIFFYVAGFMVDADIPYIYTLAVVVLAALNLMNAGNTTQQAIQEGDITQH